MIYHRTIVVQGTLGACGYWEMHATRLEAENRAEFFERQGKLARAESFDDEGNHISMSSSTAIQMMRLLYPGG